MKRFILVIIVFVSSNSITAQVKVGIKGAWNYSSAKAVYSGMKQSTGFVPGYGAGILVKVPFDGVLHFSPSVMINRRGFIVKPSSGPNSKEQYGITYIDIIPSLSTDFVKGANSFAISFGPDFGFTNFGKLKTTTNNVTSSQKLKFGYTNYGWFDLGLQASVGYYMKKTFIEAGYLLGLANINNNEETDQRNIQNRVLSLSVGYYLR